MIEWDWDQYFDHKGHVERDLVGPLMNDYQFIASGLVDAYLMVGGS
jgi:hypothetical protein